MRQSTPRCLQRLSRLDRSNRLHTPRRGIPRRRILLGLGLVAREARVLSFNDRVPKTRVTRQTGAHQASVTARYLAPDVARGLALLGIIMANTMTGWFGIWPVNYSAGPEAPDPLEQACIVFEAVFLHNRGLPMFTTLFGAGVAFIVQRELARGKSVSQVRWLLARRSFWLIVLGVLNDSLLYEGDVILIYGSMTFILMWLITLSDSFLRRVVVVLVALTGVTFLSKIIESFMFTVVVGSGGFIPSHALPQSIESYGYRLEESLWAILLTPILAVFWLPFMLIGFMWGRSGVFGDVDAHRELLSHWAIAAAAVIVCTGIPIGFEAAGISSAGWYHVFYNIDGALAFVLGPGILAMITLAVQPVQRTVAINGVPWWLVPVVALGKRSLSGYLAQHIIMAAIIETVPTSTLGTLERPQFLLLAFLIWLATLAMATLLELARLPGPFEWIHRRLTYGATWKERGLVTISPPANGYLVQATQ